MKTRECIIKEQVSGQERKVIAAVLGEVLEAPVKYAGVPSCAYEVAGWTISKEGFLISPSYDAEDAPAVKNVMGMRSRLPVSLQTEGWKCKSQARGLTKRRFPIWIKS